MPASTVVAVGDNRHCAHGTRHAGVVAADLADLGIPLLDASAIPVPPARSGSPEAMPCRPTHGTRTGAQWGTSRPRRRTAPSRSTEACRCCSPPPPTTTRSLGRSSSALRAGCYRIRRDQAHTCIRPRALPEEGHGPVRGPRHEQHVCANREVSNLGSSKRLSALWEVSNARLDAQSSYGVPEVHRNCGVDESDALPRNGFRRVVSWTTVAGVPHAHNEGVGSAQSPRIAARVGSARGAGEAERTVASGSGHRDQPVRCISHRASASDARAPALHTCARWCWVRPRQSVAKKECCSAGSLCGRMWCPIGSAE